MHTKGNQIINKMKRQPTEWEKIFANRMPTKGLVSKVCKELIQFKIKQPDLRMDKGPEQTFFQGRHTDGQQAPKKMFNVSYYQGNTNQNLNEISPHVCQYSYYQKGKK